MAADLRHEGAVAARRWSGGDDVAAALPVQSLRALVEARADAPGTFLTAYSGGRVTAEWDYGAFCRAVRGMARRLADDHDVGPGDRVMVAAGNTDVACIAYLALWGMGAISVLVSPQDLDGLGPWIAEDCAPALLLHAPVPGGTGEGLACPAWRVEAAELAEMAAADAAWPETPAPGPETPALIVYTSGTTGRSKGVVLDHGNLIVNAEATRRAHDLAPGHVHMGVLPLFHVNAMNFSLLTTFLGAGRLVLNRQFYLPEFWRIVAREGAGIASLVPMLIRQLTADTRALGAADVPATLAYVTSAAAPLSRDDLAAFQARFGLRVQQSYGLSETVNFSLITPPDLSEAGYRAAMYEAPRPTAGAPVFGNDVAIQRADGTEAAEAEEGEIVVRGWNVMQGYYRAPEANAAAFRDGWFRTGDTGFRRDVEGHALVHVTGRLKEVVKRHGETVSLLEIDEALARAGATDCAAVGFENRHAGEEIGLFVEGAEDEERAAELMRLCGALFPAHRAPQVVVFGAAIDRTPTGKIQRGRMRGAFAAYADSNFDAVRRRR